MSVAQRQFWSTVSKQYDDVVDAQLGQNLRYLVRERLRKEQALGNALEIGCGSGYFTGSLAAVAESVVATDLAPGMVEAARAALEGTANLRFQIEDCHATSFSDETFDTAFMSLVLHFTDADRALAEMRRILKPNGRLILANLDVMALSVPLRLLLLLRTLYHARVTYRRPMPKVTRKQLLDERQLRSKLETAGFTAVSCEPIRDRSCAWNCPVVYCRAAKI